MADSTSTVCQRGERKAVRQTYLRWKPTPLGIVCSSVRSSPVLRLIKFPSRSMRFSWSEGSSSSNEGMTRLIRSASDSHPARLPANTKAPYPDLTVSLASATTALRTGSLNSLWGDSLIILVGCSGGCATCEPLSRWVTALSNWVVVPAGYIFPSYTRCSSIGTGR